MLVISKQRDGELGGIPLVFHGQFCHFENPSAPPTSEIPT